MSFKYALPSTEQFAGKIPDWDDPHVVIPMSWNIFGKEVRVNVDFYINADGSMNPKVVDAWNRFFVDLPKVLMNNKALIEKNVAYDSNGTYVGKDKNGNYIKSAPPTWQEIMKHFKKIQDCFVKDDGGSIIAHCSLEWDDDDRFDSEHGNGFAMVNGKIEMGKPGDFY